MAGLSVVPLSKYCEISGENPDTVKRRIERGVWVLGRQVCKMQHVKERWIDLDEVDKWARNGGNFQAA